MSKFILALVTGGLWIVVWAVGAGLQPRIARTISRELSDDDDPNKPPHLRRRADQ